MKDLATQAERHRERMQRKKEIVDAAIERADQEKGLLLIHTGNGKGKSSAAFGMVARALGHDMRVGVAQFIKGRSDTGEEAFLRHQPGVEWYVLGEGYTWDTQNLAQDIETAQRGWQLARTMLQNETINLVVFDELTYPIRYGWLNLDQILIDLINRPVLQHVIITGRNAPDTLCEIADTVTEFRNIKHAFYSGIKAQKGIDL